MEKQIRKYKIDEYLFNLNVWQYRKAMQILPDLLSISLNTFHNYRRIPMESSQDIPYEKVILMEKLFELQMGTLAYQYPEIESLKSMLIND
ncbi:hypothetical protein AQ505_13910 [Pedobacter sp. PACM 27299]|uniref:hypothetical protein n=1 Tax=Pedobacter sp. PACM 27299 TaxID=1727164 RepID=UPI0007057483|nr:hypothetical protein [Pedobacter sp. PACM 27299]ALL06495.1 hypothetical protein AQ505_13910 [Pedobacter sp. PACM 27299]